MTNLNKLVQKQIQKIPHHFLLRLVRQKLEDQGFKDKAMLDALCKHILEKSGESFHWDDGDDGPTKNLKLDFTQQEIKDLESDVKAFLKNDLPSAIQRSVESTAKSLVKRLLKEWPEVRVDENAEMRHFRERLDLRWGAGLDPLRMMLIASREIGQVSIAV